MYFNENIRNELKNPRKIKGYTYKITNISLTNYPILLNRVYNQSLDNGVQYDTKCATLGKLAAEIWIIM